MMETRTILLLLLSSPMVLTAAVDNPFLPVLKPAVNASVNIVLPSANTIVFTLYTRESKNGEPIVLNNVESVKTSHWNARKPTAILIHGWFGNSSESSTTIRDAYLNATNDFNIILVHWGTIAQSINYAALTFDLENVAKHVTSFCNFMRKYAGLKNSNLRLIGHSLGAHIAGIVARNMKQYGLVSEIVALDPAGPGFLTRGPNDRIDKSQAKNVQVIHTNIGMLGLFSSVGTSDFFANLGPIQPGCGMDAAGVCSHYRSCDYYSESIINPKGFLATSDDGAAPAYMGGIHLDPSAKGTYHFKTNSKPPYANRKEY